MVEFGRTNSRAELNVVIRSQMATNSVHAWNTDKSGRRLLLPFQVTIGECTNAALPGRHDSVLFPRLHALLKTFISNGEVLSSVVERWSLCGPTRCHSSAETSAFFKDGHFDTVVEQRAAQISPEIPAPMTAARGRGSRIGRVACFK